ncbi:MAG: heparinase II/III family protein [Pseudomonadota bacterium]
MASASASDRLRLTAAVTASMFRGFAARLQASQAMRWRWGTQGAQRLLLAPPDLRTPDPTLAGDMYAGRFLFAGHLMETAGRSPFETPAPSEAFSDALHGFGWLRHLRAADTETSRALARSLIADWMDQHGHYRPASWKPQVTARRVISWLSHSPMILADVERPFFRRVLKMLTHQVRYLQATTNEAADPSAKLTCLSAMTFAGLAFQGWALHQRRAGRWLGDELDRQILLDGGHISRNPDALIDHLLDLLPLRQCYVARELEPPVELTRAIDRMLPMIRFFRHTEGNLAQFNGMGLTRPERIATLLAYDESRGDPMSNAVYSGFQRLQAGDTVAIADTGGPPPLNASSRAHAGCLSFELSSKAGRLIINCGAPVRAMESWDRAARSTAAHSTAVIDDTSSCRFAATGWARARLGPVIVAGPRKVDVSREDGAAERGFRASHDGYAADYGLIHERMLSLSDDGAMLSGEDGFLPAPGGRTSSQNQSFAIRFHLAPGVTTSASSRQGRIVLTLVHETWVMEAEGADITVEESVYLSSLNGPRATDQIVLRGDCAVQPHIRWRFRRLPAGSAEETAPLETDGETFLLPE